MAGMLNDIIRNARVPVVDVSQLTQEFPSTNPRTSFSGGQGSSVPDLLLGPCVLSIARGARLRRGQF
jgi:hypothetical protein